MSKTKFYLLISFIVLLFANGLYAQQDNEDSKENNPIETGIFSIVEAEEGDTVITVCKRYDVSVDEVAKLNGLFPTSHLKKGRKIRIISSSKKFQEKLSAEKATKPKYQTVRAKLNDTVETLACRHNVSPSEVVKLNISTLQVDILKRIRNSVLLDDSMPKVLTTKSRLVLEQKIKIPLEQNYRCVSQLKS